MRIGYRGRPGRTKHVGGEVIRFVDDGSGRLVADVKSEAAIAILLDPINANLFYAVDPPEPLQRVQRAGVKKDKEPEPKPEAPVNPTPPAAAPKASGKKSGRKSAKEKELIAAAATVLDNDVDVVLEIIESIDDADLRAEMLTQEEGGQAREAIIKALAG